MLNQQKLNADMSEIGKGRYRNKIESAKAREVEGETKYGQRLMRGALPLLTKAIQDSYKTWKKPKTKARWQIDIVESKAPVVAFIAIKAVIDSITLRKPMSSVAAFVGARVEDEIRCSFLVRNNPKGEGIILGAKRKRGGLGNTRRHIRRSMLHETDKGLMPEWEGWRQRDRLSCGLNLVEILRVSTGLIEYIYVQDGKRKKKSPTRYVTATKETLQWIEDYNTDRELLEPFWLPSVELPTPWQSVWEGGYSSSDTYLPKLPFIKSTNMDYIRSIKGKLEEPMEACNLIQNTPWMVNENVYKVMDWAWKNNVQVGELPSREDEELPDIPSDFHDNPDSNTTWRRIAAGIYGRNLSTRSKRLLTSKTLYVAEKLKGNRFFYPSNCDFRGRVYNVPAFLGVQGTDMSRGLLQFYRSCKIKNEKDARWLAIHGANTFGNDKVSLDERIKWAYDFGKIAIDIAQNPTEHLLWTEASTPWQFLAWCFEWRNYMVNKKIDSFLPVNMDATNNGLQILSMLTRDEYGMQATNVLPTDTPADIYRVVSDKVVEQLKIDLQQGVAFSQQWLDFGLDRKTTKRPVMCYSYGLTPYSNRAYINEWYDDTIHKDKTKPRFDEGIKYKAIHYLSTLVWNGIEAVLERPKQCMQWFQECSRLISEQQRAMSWISPSGFPVHQEYHKLHEKKISTWIGGTATHVTFYDTKDEISSRKQSNGVSPNFVHALDGAALHKSVIQCNQQEDIYDFSMVHDSYGTHSTNCDKMSKVIRNVFYEMFSVDLLQDWKHQLEEHNTDITFPEPPAYGNADLTQLKDSEYFFS